MHVIISNFVKSQIHQNGDMQIQMSFLINWNMDKPYIVLEDLIVVFPKMFYSLKIRSFTHVIFMTKGFLRRKYNHEWTIL